MTELKPCPFCGSKRVDVILYGDKRYTVSCGDCGASSACMLDKEKEIGSWNRRTSKRVPYPNDSEV